MKNLLTLCCMLFSFQFASAQCTASFTWTVDPNNSMTLIVTNTSTYTSIPGSTPTVAVNWGDGPWSFSHFPPGVNTVSHTYTSTGPFNVNLHINYYDSLNSTPYCHDSISHMITLVQSPCHTVINTSNNGPGSYNFAANNLGGGTNLTYSWDFGDGQTAVGPYVSHTYQNSGNYTVTLTTTGNGCSFTSTTLLSPNLPNCSQYSASISANVSGGLVYFTNTSPNINVPGLSIVKESYWDLGDGSSSTSSSPGHGYTSPGTYNIMLINKWKETNSQIVYCIDTAYTTVTTTVPHYYDVSGAVVYDSSAFGNLSFRIWLISHDSATNTLTAIDSITQNCSGSCIYTFSDVPPGIYRTKAALLNGSPGLPGLVPTYHDSSLYWNSATLINHFGGSSLYRMIYMKSGIYTTGPGFVGGNISQGANKGTTGGVANLLVLLRDNNDQFVRFTYTDANGDYSFPNLPFGDYTVYPELMNWTTTPSSVFSLNSSGMTITALDFKKTPTEIKPVTLGIASLPEAKLFSIFPNPVTDKMTINWTADNGTAEIELVDLMGRTVHRQSSGMGKSVNISLEHLNAGVYVVRVITNNQLHAERIVLQ